MTQPSHTDFQRFADQAYAQWEQTMTAWWDQVLDSKDFLGASGQGLAANARMRKQYEAQVDEQLGRLHLPTRGDVIRLARISTLLEERLLQMEDTVLEVRDQLAARDLTLARLEKEVVQARVEAVEARVELRERLAAMQQRLEALDAPKPAARARKPAARKPVAKKPAAKTEG